MTTKTEPAPIEWLGQEVVQQRAVEMRDAWQAWLEDKGAGLAELPGIVIQTRQLLKACGVNPIKTDEGMK